MKYQIVSVYDYVAEVYGTPYYAVSQGSAIRGFSDEINRADPNNMLYQHPKDYKLVLLGTFDDFSATFELQSSPTDLFQGYNATTRQEA